MDLNFDDETLAFQTEVRDFLEANKESIPTKSYDTAEGFEQHRRWDRVLYDAGLSVITWPKKYGGRDATLLQWVVFEEEYFRAGAPGRASANGTSMLAPTLFAHGTSEQLDRVLPKMASGEEIWAQAWSEPESGSDLASLRSTATRADGGWLLNGQKTWSSRAPFGDKAFGLFRSDPEAERHRGLTYVMFDLHADGVTVRPIAQLGGDTGFGEIFLDNVFVPDEDVIGEANHGWQAAMSTSSNERGMSLRSPARFLASAERLAQLWKDNGSPMVFSDRVADAWIKAQAYRLHTFGTVTRLASGGELGAESSVTKVFWSELDVALHQTALDIRGADGELAARSTPGPTKSSATSSPSGCWASRGRPSEIRTRRTAARLRGQHRRRAQRRRPADRGARVGRR
jgi:alkylation response protein AidB-like acyl-CoA dehydrogenase